MTALQPPPGLDQFLAALRWQESGSANGNYVEGNGQGAYQIIQSNWIRWAADAVGYHTTDPNASDAPKAIQDEVARVKVMAYYYGAGQHDWRRVARMWNGGSPEPVPNPALGSGATTDNYATALLAKMAKLGANPGLASGPGSTTAPTPTTTVTNTTTAAPPIDITFAQPTPAQQAAPLDTSNGALPTDQGNKDQGAQDTLPTDHTNTADLLWQNFQANQTAQEAAAIPNPNNQDPTSLLYQNFLGAQ